MDENYQLSFPHLRGLNGIYVCKRNLIMMITRWWASIYVHRKSIGRNQSIIAYAVASTHKASNSIVCNGVTSYNFYR